MLKTFVNELKIVDFYCHIIYQNDPLVKPDLMVKVAGADARHANVFLTTLLTLRDTSKMLFLHFDAVFGKARVLLLQEEKPYVIALYVVVYKY